MLQAGATRREDRTGVVQNAEHEPPLFGFKRKRRPLTHGKCLPSSKGFGEVTLRRALGAPCQARGTIGGWGRQASPPHPWTEGPKTLLGRSNW